MGPSSHGELPILGGWFCLMINCPRSIHPVLSSFSADSVFLNMAEERNSQPVITKKSQQRAPGHSVKFPVLPTAGKIHTAVLLPYDARSETVKPARSLHHPQSILDLIH